MKTRLFENTVRVRLTRSEVDRLGRGESLREETRFFSGQLGVEIRVAESPGIDAAFDGASIVITVPEAEVAHWASPASQLEGLYAAHGTTKVAVEKDYACLHKTGEQNEGTFPNPAADAKID